MTSSTIEITEAQCFLAGQEESKISRMKYNTYQKQTELNKSKEPGMVDVREKVLLESADTKYTIKNLRGLDIVKLIVVMQLISSISRGQRVTKLCLCKLNHQKIPSLSSGVGESKKYKRKVC